MALDEPRDDDKLYDSDGIKWVVASDQHDTIMGRHGVRVDHQSGWFGSGFTIRRLGPYSGGCC